MYTRPKEMTTINIIYFLYHYCSYAYIAISLIPTTPVCHTLPLLAILWKYANLNKTGAKLPRTPS